LRTTRAMRVWIAIPSNVLWLAWRSPPHSDSRKAFWRPQHNLLAHCGRGLETWLLPAGRATCSRHQFQQLSILPRPWSWFFRSRISLPPFHNPDLLIREPLPGWRASTNLYWGFHGEMETDASKLKRIYSMPRLAQYSSSEIYWSFSRCSFLYCSSA